jgi:hypothetical protein
MLDGMAQNYSYQDQYAAVYVNLCGTFLNCGLRH